MEIVVVVPMKAEGAPVLGAGFLPEAVPEKTGSKEATLKLSACCLDLSGNLKVSSLPRPHISSRLNREKGHDPELEGECSPPVRVRCAAKHDTC